MSQMSSFNRSPSASSINSHSQEDSEFFKRFRQLEEESIINGITNGSNNFNLSHESLNSENTNDKINSTRSSAMSIPKISSPLVTQEDGMMKDGTMNLSSLNESLNNVTDPTDSKTSLDISTEFNGQDYSRKSSSDESYMIKTPTSHKANGDLNDFNLENIAIISERNDGVSELNKNISKRKTQIFSMDNFISKRKSSSNVRQSLINPGIENVNNVVKCASCNNEIGNSDYIEALNGVWHTFCFKCKVYYLHI